MSEATKWISNMYAIAGGGAHTAHGGGINAGQAVAPTLDPVGGLYNGLDGGVFEDPDVGLCPRKGV